MYSECINNEFFCRDFRQSCGNVFAGSLQRLMIFVSVSCHKLHVFSDSLFSLSLSLLSLLRLFLAFSPQFLSQLLSFLSVITDRIFCRCWKMRSNRYLSRSIFSRNFWYWSLKSFANIPWKSRMSVQFWLFVQDRAVLSYLSLVCEWNVLLSSYIDVWEMYICKNSQITVII